VSVDTLLQYIAQLPPEPREDRVLYRTGPGRVAGGFGALRVTSAFQAIVDRAGALAGHEALLRASNAAGAAVSPGEALEAVSGEEAVVRFDRLCRTVHALNWFSGAPEGALLFLGVDHRLLQFVPEEHGTTFQRILSGFGVLPARVVISLPALAGGIPGLVENVFPSYRLRNFRVAIEVTGWLPAAAPRLARLRPDFVRVRWNPDVPGWVSAAHAAGARLVVTHIEQAEDRDAALRAGADLLQGYCIGRPRESAGIALGGGCEVDAEAAR